MGISSFFLCLLVLPPFTSFRFLLFFASLSYLTIFKRSVTWCFLFCAADGTGDRGYCYGGGGFENVFFSLACILSLFFISNNSSLPNSFLLGYSILGGGYFYEGSVGIYPNIFCRAWVAVQVVIVFFFHG